LLNFTSRRTSSTRCSIVVAANRREVCCATQPASIASNTASSGAKNATPEANIDSAEPGTTTRANRSARI